MKKFIQFSFLLALALVTVAVSAQKKSFLFDVKISGKGAKAIIFIPGFTCSADVWKETKVPFENDFTSYTLTMPGFAGIPAEENPTFKNWEKSIAEYIQQNKINKPILIGHSMGGGLAMAIAADYPDMLSKVIIVDALPCLAAIQNPSFKTNDSINSSAAVVQFKAMSDEQFYQMQKNRMPQLLANSSKIDEVVSWSVKSDRKTLAMMYSDFSNTDLREKIAAIKCPALVLLESYFVNMKPMVEGQYKNLKSAQFQYADKGLHFIMYDDKEWFDAQLSKFIKS
ncbi:alpha/beta fold hydrolase [Flavobacterium sp. GT3R68]|uniref:alpha/beta fold hydrolase n=1 Tax=Flavobacterium sp. GT3R68 TaxID=2594437 RepID=UPI000F875CF3|nr:alpha/beta hydrolase [Flavobacterium sp. GT3R68]RTY95868.1 alpha/beta hydrolase [Flavobacterium sp. GSN2]TRW93640.1 alpha/beta hydrolase [Flavobacterium sp. GT3R68]